MSSGGCPSLFSGKCPNRLICGRRYGLRDATSASLSGYPSLWRVYRTRLNERTLWKMTQFATKWLYLMIFRCSSRSLVEIVPSPPNATHCAKSLNDSHLLVAAWIRARNSTLPRYLSRNSVRSTQPSSGVRAASERKTGISGQKIVANLVFPLKPYCTKRFWQDNPRGEGVLYVESGSKSAYNSFCTPSQLLSTTFSSLKWSKRK